MVEALLLQFFEMLVPILSASCRTLFKSHNVSWRIRKLIASQYVRFASATTTVNQVSVEQRYHGKLLKKAHEKGVRDIEELKKVCESDIIKARREFARIEPQRELKRPEPTARSIENEVNFQKVDSKMESSVNPVNNKTSKKQYKTLNDYLDLDKTQKLSNQEIEFLWRARWSSKDYHLSAVLSPFIFAKFMLMARKNPTFVLPLPCKVDSTVSDQAEEGIELHYIQWSFQSNHTTHCLMTSLAEFKLHQEFARPHTVLEFHAELSHTKELVLMNGQIQPDTNMKPDDVQLLLWNLQRFYGAIKSDSSIAKQRLKLLNDFTRCSSDFNVESLIELSRSLEN